MDFIFDPSLAFYAPLYEADGGSFKSRDAYGHLCTVSGALWRPDGRNFDGVDDKINLPDAPALSPPSQITLEAWFKPSQTAAIGRIVSRFPSDYHGWSMYHSTTIGFQLYAGGSLGGAASAANTIAQGVWHHSVCTYDGANMTVYVNANVSGSPLAKTGSIAYTALQPAIGLDNNVNWQAFNGTIGEVRIYNRALSALEVQRNYLATKWRYQ